MACYILVEKPLPEPMLAYCPFYHGEQTPVKFESKFKHFYSMKCNSKCHLQNGSHFVLAPTQCFEWGIPGKQIQLIHWDRDDVFSISLMVSSNGFLCGKNVWIFIHISLIWILVIIVQLAHQHWHKTLPEPVVTPCWWYLRVTICHNELNGINRGSTGTHSAL